MLPRRCVETRWRYAASTPQGTLNSRGEAGPAYGSLARLFSLCVSISGGRASTTVPVKGGRAALARALPSGGYPQMEISGVVQRFSRVSMYGKYETKERCTLVPRCVEIGRLPLSGRGEFSRTQRQAHGGPSDHGVGMIADVLLIRRPFDVSIVAKWLRTKDVGYVSLSVS